MAYDIHLEDRINQIIQEKSIPAAPKKMMGGLCYMLDDKMCFGIVKDELMARVGDEYYLEALKINGAKEMNFTGRSMKGYVFIEAEALLNSKDLEFWIQKCVDFNPKALSSKKKKTKK